MQILHPMGEPLSADWILIQPVDDHDQGMLPEEIHFIRGMISASFAVVPVKVDWFRDLTPWPAPATFTGQQDFGDGAANTLNRIMDAIPAQQGDSKASDRPKIILGGYSLAGLFALWAGYQTDAFDGIVAASPSVWYPGWEAYMANHRMKCQNVYLSQGDREERTRNPVMRTVGDRIKMQAEFCRKQGIRCILEWNEGNHFKDPDKRTATGFAWIMKGDNIHG